MTRKYENVILSVEGEKIAARVRVRDRKLVAKARDMERREAREFARDREYA